MDWEDWAAITQKMIQKEIKKLDSRIAKIESNVYQMSWDIKKVKGEVPLKETEPSQTSRA